jgi:hypothetical protein
MKALSLLITVTLLGLLQSACNGNDCSALTDPLTDGDSDCIADSSDNCPGIANFDQSDLDGDGVGAACDADDTDENVASISADPNASVPNLSGSYMLQSSNCSLTDETLDVAQTGSEITVSGDRNGEYDAALTTGEDFITHLTLQRSSQSCDAQIANTTTLSFYCHDDADAKSDGCVNVFGKL